MRNIVINAVKESGFDEYRELVTTEIIMTKDVVDQCLKCNNTGKNYSCPPLSGDLQQNIDRVLKYENALLINKIIPMPETREGFEQMGKLLGSIVDDLRKRLKDLPVEVRTPGGCDLCKECAAITDEACRFPDEIRYSLEGSGMDICAMAKKFDMTYNAGSRGLGYFFMVLF